MQVLFNDLASQYLAIQPEIDRAVKAVLEQGWFIGGRQAHEFERRFAKLCGTNHAVGLGNATDGLFLALKALGVGPGDEVITPAWSWISSAEVISFCGARVVFADVEPHTFTIAASEIQKKLTPNTKAVIAVHLYGQMADVTSIKAVCDQAGVYLIEDCSQAHLASGVAGLAGTTGHCGVFSFYPTKNLGAFGDAGCLVTQQDEFALRVRRLANHGGLSKDEHLMEGMNSRLDTLQAAILNVKLNHLQAWTHHREHLVNIYRKRLASVKEISLPVVAEGARHVYHLFVVRAQKRNELRSFLDEHAIQTLVHYPQALPFEPAYGYLQHTAKEFPVASQLPQQVLSLPLHPFLTEAQIESVCDMICQFYGN
ncbi:MAG: DegT/DnrJ/EryC1/StrS family aminotransferase [Cyclobacteriaceae bacterium]|nr:DegT/DnrJ/EryC1/StrS family aminotransferase [Cyclobacteriaceae bacterium]